ncbi:MAG: UDP-N-acetylmuramoyl-L-alanine--D-glutamate ligase [Desulfohalobiaceae bacterium]
MHNLLQDKQLAVLGAGRSGQAAARLCSSQGARVRLLEQNSSCLSLQEQKALQEAGISLELGGHQPGQLAGAELVVLSPGIPQRSIQHLLQGSRAEVCSELELASWFVHQPVLAVTGTSGKTTTVQVMAHVLEQAGFKVFLGGNIGVPLSEYLLGDSEAQLLVLEVSSFQLMHTYSLRPQVALLLNFAANHLDYHQSLEEYLGAKLRLFKNQEPVDLAILPQGMRAELQARQEIGGRQVYFQAATDLECPGLPGPHNARNLQAAYLACSQFGVEKQGMSQALQDFQPDPHRLQIVAESQGILFVDDSKATTLHALQAALESFSRPILLLAGGRFKGGDPEQLCALLQSRVKAAALFGEDRELLEQAWSGYTRVFTEPGLRQAMYRLMGIAQPGDMLLLSPATSSFDQFKDYQERGLAFQALVQEVIRDS